MDPENFETRWAELNRVLSREMTQWRKEHPKATLRQIEQAMDERIARLRARMIEDVIGTSAAVEWEEAEEAHPPKCPECGKALKKRGKKTRALQTQGGEALEIKREHGQCPACGARFFPPR